jgi:hypothetical protein
MWVCNFMDAVLLFTLVPAIVVSTILYAVFAEARHSRVRRTRWELWAERSRLRARPARRYWRPADLG